MATGTEPFLLSAAGQFVMSLVCNVLTEVSFRTYDAQRETIRRQLSEAARSGRLPINHDVQRAVARAHLRACDALLGGILQNRLTDRPVPPDRIAATWVAANDSCLQNVRKWLLSGIETLDQKKRETPECRQCATETMAGFSNSARSLANDAVHRQANQRAGAAEASRAASLQIAGVGRWPDNTAALVLLDEAFQHDTTGWAGAFSLCFIEELKTDERLHRIVVHFRMAELQAGVSAAHESILTHLKALSIQTLDVPRSARAMLRRQAAIMGRNLAARLGEFAKRVLEALGDVEARLKSAEDALRSIGRQLSWEKHFLFRPDDATQPRDSEISVFHYSARFDDFVGREAEFNRVHNALFDPATVDGRNFRWLLVHGDAGTGKSRFAQELIGRRSPEWEAAGFVLPQAIVTPNFSRKVEIQGPTLMVVDYGISFRDTFPDFMEGWAERARHLAHPVRVLILVRRETDPMVIAMLENSGDHLGAEIAKCEAPDRVKLTRLESEALVIALMRGRLTKTAARFGEEPKSISDSDLLDVLDKFDSQRRPLFAAMVAHGIQRGLLPQAGATYTDGEEARIQLFTKYLSEQRTKRWASVARQEAGSNKRLAAKLRRRHETIAMLSTIVRGLSHSSFRALIEGMDEDAQRARDMLVCETDGEDELSLELLRHILEGPVDEHFPAMQPDLIGEWFVLSALLEAPADMTDDDDRKFHDKRRGWLLETAWTMEPQSTTEFVRLAGQDYPATAERLNWLRRRWEASE